MSSFLSESLLLLAVMVLWCLLMGLARLACLCFRRIGIDENFIVAKHFLFDVLAGYGIGFAEGAFSFALYKYFVR